jgi:hypothetical protein
VVSYALDPWDPRSVARWAAAKVFDAAETRLLWLRVTLEGPGYMLTPPGTAPRGGVWQRVALVDVEDAMRISQRGPRGWPALCRLAEKIEEALPPNARAA